MLELEILLNIGRAVAVRWVAQSGHLPEGLWTSGSLLVGLASLLIPLPFLRAGIAAILAFGSLFVYKRMHD
ncbi:MAG: hypothetical protein HYU36_03880 [Planctomycetes bacterium]|nr:hypothetical protein [Planctomycetota bacterium]